MQEYKNDSIRIPFCGGYVDADNANGSDVLAPRIYNTTYITVTDDFVVKGLSMGQGVALASAKSLGSKWFTDLIATGGDLSGTNFNEYDLALLEEDLMSYTESFADDELLLLEHFQEAWIYMMTADRFLVSAA